MGKNYDLIATVDIDIATPIVDNTSFDNLLIMGPPPKGGLKTPAYVGVYGNLTEVEDAGFVSTGEGADPVGVAARVAFAQSPTPTQVYIAVQKLSTEAVASAAVIKKTNAAIEQYVGTKENLTGCAIKFSEASRKLSVTLEGPASGVENTGMSEVLGALAELGCTVSVAGKKVETVSDFKETGAFQELSGMSADDPEVKFSIDVEKDGAGEVSYAVVIEYPSSGVPAVASVVEAPPLNSPEKELELPATTIARALGMDGWYVLCSAGIDSKYYEEIAAYIETQEKMFAYTELDCFPAPGADRAEGEDQVIPSVGTVYFRTLGCYGREKTSQALEDIPDANLYENVAFVAKWLNYSSGSETSAFKSLSSIYPSELTGTEMKLLAEKNLNYFITVGNKNITMNGKTVGGEWADVIRFRDWLKNDMQLRVVNLFVTRPKVPYTDSGIALVQNQMIASLKASQDAGGIAETEFDADGNEIPGFVTSVPLSASLSASEKASRRLTKCKFKARLAGAIHFAELKGSLTYEL